MKRKGCESIDSLLPKVGIGIATELEHSEGEESDANKEKTLEWHKEVYNNLSENQKLIFSQFYGPWGFLPIAREVYDIMYEHREDKTNSYRIVTCGNLARNALRHLLIVKDMLGISSYNSLCKKLEEIDDFFMKDERFPYKGSFECKDDVGCIRWRPLRGIVNDMIEASEKLTEFLNNKDQVHNDGY